MVVKFYKTLKPLGILKLVSHIHTIHAFTITPLSTKATTFSSLMASKKSDLEHLEGKTLLSVQECIDAYNVVKGKKDEEDPDAANVVFLDASWWHKGDLNGRKMFEDGPRIPNSKHFDISDIALTPNLNPRSLPNMLPTPNFFAATMDSYGIRNQDHIIITARESVYFTPRVWFLFKTFGHDPSKLHLMQGSLERWIELGGDVETEAVIVPVFQDLKLKEDYSYHVESATNVCGIESVLGAITTNEEEDDEEELLLDSRGSSFAKGHMPGAIHLPYSQWVLPESTLEWKPVDELKAIFADNGVNPMTDKNIICSCGSGVSVCHTLLALELCGRDLGQEEKTKMYDASWSEYGKIDDTPKIRSK